MQFFQLLSVFASFMAVSSGVSAGLVSDASLSACKQETVAYEGFIGKDNNVKIQYSHCGDVPLVAADGEVIGTDKAKRQSTDVCGATCNTFCFTPSGGGPNESDCTVIADALLYDSQNTGPLFNITASGTATDKITMQYGSCLTYFLNQDSVTLEYCRSDWASLVNWLSSDCDAANNAHGGLCVATDQRWYVQVQNVSG